MDMSIAAQPIPTGHAMARKERLPLWNPRAATYWGLLLSPAFSAYIHMRNWEALGQDDKVRETRAWFYLMLGYVVSCGILSAVSEAGGMALTAPSSIALVLMVAWHRWGGRQQERYVAALTRGAYTRRPWGKAVAAALGTFAAAIILVAVVNVVVNVSVIVQDLAR